MLSAMSSKCDFLLLEYYDVSVRVMNVLVTVFIIFQIFLPKVTVMYILAMTAFAFYITKFPERIFPGKWDL